MKAYQVTEFSAPLVEQEVPTPEPLGTEVLVRVVHAGVCHSDLHIHDGYYSLAGGAKLDLLERGIRLPHTMGHELYGEVAAIGADVTGVSIGDRRLVYPWIGCGQCGACLAGNENDYCLVPNEKYLVDIGDLDPLVATPYSCSGVTVYSAISKALPIGNKEWLVIMGAGGLGLNAVAIAKALDVANVLVVDIDDSKLDAATEMGADAVLNPGTDDAVASLQKMTDGGPRAVVDTVGAESTANLGIAALLKGGRYVIVGLFGGGVTLSLPTIPLRAISVLGSYTGNLTELKALIELAKAGKVKPLPVSTRPLSEVSETLDELREGKIVGRTVLSN